MTSLTNSSPLEEQAKQKSRGGYKLSHIPNAQQLRKNLTPWELQLWRHLSSKRMQGYRFRRQQPIGPYIVDFINFERKLIIELDGSHHQQTIQYDQQRDLFLQRSGYKILRFWNNEIDQSLAAVLETILTALTPHASSGACGLLSAAPPQGGS